MKLKWWRFRKTSTVWFYLARNLAHNSENSQFSHVLFHLKFLNYMLKCTHIVILCACINSTLPIFKVIGLNKTIFTIKYIVLALHVFPLLDFLPSRPSALTCCHTKSKRPRDLSIPNLSVSCKAMWLSYIKRKKRPVANYPSNSQINFSWAHWGAILDSTWNPEITWVIV